MGYHSPPLKEQPFSFMKTHSVPSRKVAQFIEITSFSEIFTIKPGAGTPGTQVWQSTGQERKRQGVFQEFSGGRWVLAISYTVDPGGNGSGSVGGGYPLLFFCLSSPITLSLAFKRFSRWALAFS